MMRGKILPFAIALLVTSATAVAQDSKKLVIDGETLASTVMAPAHVEAFDTLYSGWHFRSKETQDLQLDDFESPAMVFVDGAIDQFNTVEGVEGLSCQSCHNNVEDFAGLRATLPRVEDGQLVSLEDLVNECRTERMGAEALKYTNPDLIAMTALIGLQSRGMPMAVKIDGEAKPFWEQGKDIYYTRFGQLDVACATCHEDNYGQMLRAEHLSQGQVNGFPNYRLKNAKLNSIHARFKGCMRNIRAVPFPVGGPEFKALELYVSSRGQGLAIETPSVRN